ncbi:MAG: cytochrome c family protein [Bacteroidales bacterium]|nr:cytochrome c family protein [Bacteroidales bacterium]
MTHPVRIIGCAVVTAWVVGAVIAVWASESPPSTPPPSVTLPASPAALGYAGCAARGCHGGATIGDAGELLAPSYRNACSYWLKFDRHTQAYQVLFSPRSQRMVELLAAGGPVVPAHQQERCLACHTTPTLAAGPETPEIVRLRSEGVSCDACHTQPGRSTVEWLEPHKKGWRAGGLADSYATHGLNWLGDTATRARLCAGCHVGAPAREGLPLREVNHDLIAAGHPRLNFEYATYAALLPPHWGEESRDRHGATLPVQPGHDVLEWYVGQLASAAVGLELLNDTSQRPDGIWPEFTAFNCYACHFDFTTTVPPGTDWRQNRAMAVQKTHTGGPGRVPWNRATLSVPILELLQGDSEFTKNYQELARAMDRLGRTRTTIPVTAHALAETVRMRATHPPEAFAGPMAGLALVRGLRLAIRDYSSMDWDDASQFYYALRAANRARNRVSPTQPRTPDAIDTELDALAGFLRFPRGKTIVNSPVTFDPEKVGSILKRFPAMWEEWYNTNGLTHKPSR